ncbi:ArsR family transcriptional regulator [Fulvimonas yonginensis]|uniref:ArsR family transcriptional regulator n=1 Tax=Fulvimonas yonginensis TaxID=1495200 RepID=A0ABU8JA75_9GAMM
MTKTFAERLREDRRLVMLRLLSEQPGYRMNSSNLHAGLHHLAVAATRDDVATDLHWLKDQGMVLLEPVPEVPSLYLVTITARGGDVAAGHANVPGISRPTPR